MKTITIAVLLSINAFAADEPKATELTDKQKLSIVEAQRDLNMKQAERNALESRLKDLNYVEIPKAQQALNDAATKATPPGYQLQADLTLREIPKPPAPAAPASPAK